MQREIKFRGIPNLDEDRLEELKVYIKDVFDGKFVYGNLVQDNYIVGDVMDVDDEYITFEYWIPVVPETVGQFTGLYDSTKWEELSDEEKQEFYVKNRSNDGVTITYQTREQVKHLWLGREIYEGDLLDLDGMEEEFEYIKVEFEEGRFVANWYGDVGYSTENGFNECGGPIDICDTEDLREYNRKVIGNLHVNPELLEVSNA